METWNLLHNGSLCDAKTNLNSAKSMKIIAKSYIFFLNSDYNLGITTDICSNN